MSSDQSLVQPSPTPSVDFVVVDVETACSRVSSICQVSIVGFRDGSEVFAFFRPEHDGPEHPHAQQERDRWRAVDDGLSFVP